MVLNASQFPNKNLWEFAAELGIAKLHWFDR